MRRIAAGVIAILICMIASVITAMLHDFSTEKRKYLSRSWVVPTLLILGFAVLAQKPLYVLIAIIIYSVGISEKIYSKFVVALKFDDLGVWAPISIVFLLFPINLGILSQTIVLQFYSVLLQSFLTLIGLVFTLGIFILGTRDYKNIEQIKNLLKGFLSFFILVSCLSLIGMLTSQRDIDVSQQFIFSTEDVKSSKMLLPALLVGTLCIFMASMAYIFIIFSIFVEEHKK